MTRRELAARTQEIVAELEAGLLTTRQIAERHGLTPARIRAIAAAAGISLAARRPPPGPDSAAAIVATVRRDAALASMRPGEYLVAARLALCTREQLAALIGDDP